MNCSKDGKIYGIVWTFGKPPADRGLMGWEIDLYQSTKGRSLGISNLRKLHTEIIYTFELRLQDLLAEAKPAIPQILDRRVRKLER